MATSGNMVTTSSFPYKYKKEHDELKTKFQNLRKPESMLKQSESANRRLEAVDALGWTADGQRITLCAKDGSVRVYRAEEARGTEEMCMAGTWTHADPHPFNGELVSCVGWDGKIRLLDLRGGYSECKGEEKIFASSFSCDGNYISIHTRTDAIHVFDTRSFTAPIASANLKHEVNATVWSGSGSVWAATGHGEIAAIDFNIKDSPIVTPMVAHQGSTCSLARNSAGSAVVSGGIDGVVAVWDVSRGFCERTIVEAQSPVTTTTVSACGRLVAFGCGKEGDTAVYVGGLNTGVLYANLELPASVTKVAFHPKRTTLAFALHQQQGDSSIQLVDFD